MKIFLIVLGALIFLTLAVGVAFQQKLIRRGSSVPGAADVYENPLFEPTVKELMAFNATRIKKFSQLPTETLSITTEDGLKLIGKLIRGTEPVTVICCHGYDSLPLYDYCAVSEIFLNKGYSVFMPHMRGHGESEGKYVGFGVLDAQDVRHWVLKMQDVFPANDIFLHGISMGGASVLNSADLFHNGEVSGIISDCAFTTPHEVFSHLIGDMYHLPRFPFIGSFELANMLIAHYDFHTFDVRNAITESAVPCIYICGDEDRFIPRDMAQSIADRCEASMLVHGAGHAASYMMETEKYKDFVIDFIEKYRGKN